MEGDVGDRDLNNLPQRKLKLINGSISSYWSIFNSSERLHIINQEDELVDVIGDIESEGLG